MKDIQSGPSVRKISLEKVGVKGVKYPIKVLNKRCSGEPAQYQDTVATINMYVELPQEFRGTHMSRFLEVLNRHELISIATIKVILEDMQSHLAANSVHLEVAFAFFISKSAPKTGAGGLMSYDCRLIGSLDHKKGFDLILEVNVPIMTVCPCSRAISVRGAHNQRAVIHTQIRSKKSIVWIEDLVEAMENCGSSPLYSVLKRPDEKYVTEESYKNPRFVEDVAREAAHWLASQDNIGWFNVEVESFESIHNYSAFAKIERH